VIIEVHAEAGEEIEAAGRYLNRRSPGLGDRFLTALAECLDAIVQNPCRFAKLETLPGDHGYRRALVEAFRYAIILELLEETILVVSVTHTSREPNYWLDRRSR
jgi:plasmid stabilization system protein ParE